MSSRPWNCPFCNKPVTIGDVDTDIFSGELTTTNKHGVHKMVCRFIVCPNEECKEYVLEAWLLKGKENTTKAYPPYTFDEVINFWRLIPESSAKVFPEYVPKPIIADYNEACAILSKSPKASATLSRRCLQGMIRDYYNITRPKDHKGNWTLKNEIEAIKEKVEPDVWAAIDAVRSIGNIGAHMEKDINLIIDVDSSEADKLKELIEMLIEEWYINRQKRQERLTAIKNIAVDKITQKKNANNGSTGK